MDLNDPLWEHAIEWDMPSFLKEYTLHDSGLAETRIFSFRGAIIRIDWDLHWNQAIASGFSTLLLRFAEPYSITWTQGSWRESTLSGAVSELLTLKDREKMLMDGTVNLSAFPMGQDGVQPCAFDESLTRTVFEGINFGLLTVLHTAQVRFLCLNEFGTCSAIPRKVN